MKVALAQINTTVGDLGGNRSLILEAYRQASSSGADLVVFPEMAVPGYPPRDLLEEPKFVNQVIETQRQLATEIDSPWAVVGGVEPKPGQGKPLFNAALVLGDRRIQSIIPKILLPAYDVFDESRYFEPGKPAPPIQIAGGRVGITICEDIWSGQDPSLKTRYHQDPVARLVERGIDLLVNISASPFHYGKGEMRKKILEAIALKYGVPFVYANLVGGNDDLIFDGRSMVLNSHGKVSAVAKTFRPDLLIVDSSNLPPGPVQVEEAAPSEILEALILGVRDYCQKTGFTKAVVGLSGGMDSSLTAVIAVLALGAEKVLGLIMPSPYTSSESIQDAAALAESLKIETRTVEISPLMATYGKALEKALQDTPPGVAAENIQARIRGNLLMAVSNAFGHLVLTTGNKSELAMGYCTLYGDLAGGLAVISDVPKTMVYEVAREVNRLRPLIPGRVFSKPPSAELRPGQKDSDTLPPYEILDPILRLYVEEHRSIEEIVGVLSVSEELVREVVSRLIANEYKRRQSPLGLRVTSRAFGSGRRWPIAHRYFS